MADIFLTVVPVAPTVPTLGVSTNKDRTSNLTAPRTHDSIVSVYKQRRARRVLPVAVGGVAPNPDPNYVPLGPPGGGTGGDGSHA